MHNIGLLCRGRPQAIVLAGLIIVAFGLPATSFADNYLDSLEAEADQTTILEKAQNEQQKLLQTSSIEPAQASAEKKASKKQKVTDKSGSPVTAEQFEIGLYNDFPGNYAVYTTLSDDDKKQVLNAYEEAKNVKGLMRFGPSLRLILDFASNN